MQFTQHTVIRINEGDMTFQGVNVDLNGFALVSQVRYEALIKELLHVADQLEQLIPSRSNYIRRLVEGKEEYQ